MVESDIDAPNLNLHFHHSLIARLWRFPAATLWILLWIFYQLLVFPMISKNLRRNRRKSISHSISKEFHITEYLLNIQQQFFSFFFVNEYFLCVSFDRLLMERRIWWKKDEFLTIDNEWKIDVFGTSRTPVHRFKPESLMSARKLFLTMWGSLRRRDINYH